MTHQTRKNISKGNYNTLAEVKVYKWQSKTDSLLNAFLPIS